VKHLSGAADVSREAYATLGKFAELLLRWNCTVNLVARGDEPLLWERHIQDSLQLVPFVPPGTLRGIDLGSGAGFPGMVLALATRVPFDLIEADRRKAAFLFEAARVTGAPVRIHPTRIEASELPPASLVTARALATLPRLLALAAPLLAPGGICLFLKGANADAELTHAESEWQMQVDGIPSCTAPGARILRISNLRRVPRSD
jgi:16S rRNA (guanine527-N7)-methyltransferase